jgi:hypothetical protein
MVWPFGIVLICVAAGELFNRHNNMFLTFVEHKFVVGIYSIGSLPGFKLRRLYLYVI